MKKTLLSLALCATGIAQAQLYHLGIDLSNPSAAVFTATTLPSEDNSFGTSLFDGISLQVFFNPGLPAVAGGTTIGTTIGTLRPFQINLAYNTWFSDFASPGLVTELNIYREGRGSEISQTFSTFFAALEGSATLDLSGQIGHLPGLGTRGPLIAGWTGNQGPRIGSWEITAVPELPVGAHLGLYGVGFAGVWLYRRSRKA